MSPLDIIPTKLLKEGIEPICPALTSGVTACVQTLLKGPGLDQTALKRFRPIYQTNLHIKILEKIVLEQLFHALNSNIFKKFESCFRKLHSTETAILRVKNDSLMAADSGACSVLLLLDLCAAFDTIDHFVLIDRLLINVAHLKTYYPTAE